MNEPVTKKVGLLENKNIIFIENTADLLKDLGMLLDNIDSIINNDRKLRNYAYDHRLNYFLRNQIEVNRGNVKSIMNILIKHLRYIKRYDKRFAQLVSGYGPMESKQRQILEAFSNISNDSSKLSANIDILLENVERLEDEELKLKIRKILNLIKTYSNEEDILNADLYDVNNWNLHVHDDINFFKERVEAYLKGGATRDKKQFNALNSFKDQNLNFESKEVKMIDYLAQFTHRVEEQTNYILKLISFLNEDIEDNEWKRNVATKKFYDNVDLYADTFRKDFLNNPFADSLLKYKYKSKIGEQPFAWIEILTKMIKVLERLIQMKNTTIDNARIYLNNLFRNRIDSLKSSITVLSLQLNRVIKEENQDVKIMKEIEEGIKRIENITHKLWKNRKKRFKKIKIEIDNKNIRILPEMNKLFEMFSIIQDSDKLKDNAQGLIEFSRHTEKIKMLVGDYPTEKNIGHLLMFDFNLARMSEFISGSNFIEKAIKQKDMYVKGYELSKIRKSINELINLYLELINFISLVIITDMAQIDTKTAMQKINQFRSEYYG